MKLTPFFKEVIEMRWSEFHKMEQGEDHTSAQAVVLAIIRACSKGKLPAIKESLNRIDGKLAEQIEVEYPKFFITYPHAKAIESGVKLDPKKAKAGPPSGKNDTFELSTLTAAASEPEPLVTGSLRDTLQRMSTEPKSLVTSILDAAADVETRESYASDFDPPNDPLVKSVIVAGLLKMAHNGSLNAIFEVFDNLDGKLVDKIKIMGDDVYMTSYDTIAPAGAKKVNGVYQLEADNTTSVWVTSLKRKEEDRRMR